MTTDDFTKLKMHMLNKTQPKATTLQFFSFYMLNTQILMLVLYSHLFLFVENSTSNVSIIYITFQFFLLTL